MINEQRKTIETNRMRVVPLILYLSTLLNNIHHRHQAKKLSSTKPQQKTQANTNTAYKLPCDRIVPVLSQNSSQSSKQSINQRARILIGTRIQFEWQRKFTTFTAGVILLLLCACLLLLSRRLSVGEAAAARPRLHPLLVLLLLRPKACCVGTA